MLDSSFALRVQQEALRPHAQSTHSQLLIADGGGSARAPAHGAGAADRAAETSVQPGDDRDATLELRPCQLPASRSITGAITSGRASIGAAK